MWTEGKVTLYSRNPPCVSNTVSLSSPVTGTRLVWQAKGNPSEVQCQGSSSPGWWPGGLRTVVVDTGSFFKHWFYYLLHAKCSTDVRPRDPHNKHEVCMTIPILKMRKLGLSDVKYFVHVRKLLSKITTQEIT